MPDQDAQSLRPMPQRLVFQFVAAALLGAPLVAANWLPYWSYSVAYVVYWGLAVSATALLILVVCVLAASTLALRLAGRASNSASKLLAILAVWLAAFAAAFAIAHATQPELPAGSDLMTFNSARWKEDESAKWIDGDLTDRQKMLAGAISAARAAPSRASVEAQLGPSLDTSYFRESGRDLIYVLGPERGMFSIDSEWLLIWLSSDGKVVRHQIATD